MKAIIGNLRGGERERIMYCPTCGNESSADKADYFFTADPDFKFKCCGKTMEVVVKHTVFDEIK